MTQRIQPGSGPGLEPQPFEWKVSSAGGGAIQLTLRGDIDLAAHDRLGKLIKTLLNGGSMSALLIDISAVTFLDCGGVGALVAGRRLADDVGCEYRVMNAEGIGARILDVTGARTLLGH